LNICIVIPFDKAEKETPIWAVEESSIDFKCDYEKAARCTSAFAATELKNYLHRTLTCSEISFSSVPIPDCFSICLDIADIAGKDCSFSIEQFKNALRITGKGRTGLLYGVYELLRMQGWRWFVPGSRGEIAPPLADALKLPENKIKCSPSMSLGRGFDFEGISKDSIDLYLWMARNRMNIASYRSATQAFCEKLGMNLKIAAGHIFSDLLDPDLTLPSGKTIWQEHPEWFGVPADGVRTKENALSTQFCVSCPDLMEFLTEGLIKYVESTPGDTTAIDVWGFDTWGGICTCPECTKLGNGTDQMLHMCSALRDGLNNAHSSGRLERNFNLLMCGYEGTSTIQAPENPAPQNLIDAGDYLVYYPILRCYAHDLFDDTCSRNQIYGKTLKDWHKRCPDLKMHFGEYYNVSKFEDLPLLFTQHMPQDIKGYFDAGIRGSTYMHIPIVNWGMRAITQLMYAQFTWNVNTDADAFISEYFELWYGPYSGEMREIYSMVESAWSLMSSWRAWDIHSLLSQLQSWDGGKPESILLVDDHFGSTKGAVDSGLASIELLSDALDKLNVIRESDKIQSARTLTDGISIAVNPIEARKMESLAQYEWRLGEDRRGLIYGLDIMRLMTYVSMYHESLRISDSHSAKQAWEKVEQTAEALDAYYMPMTFDYPGPGFESKDALTRSQLRDVLRRCRKHINQHEHK